MKFIRFKYKGQERYGAINKDRVKFLISDYFSRELNFSNESASLKDVELLAPCKPSKLVCLGKNYEDHALEMKSEVPQEPIVFIKPSTSVIGPGEEIIMPPQSKRVDYEGELAVVISKTAKNIKQSQAMDYVLGLTCANDVTARDLQKGQWTVAKGFDTFCPLGPYIVSGLDPHNLELSTHLNGELRQKTSTGAMVFKVPFLIEYISHIMTLLPGDVILSGTPSGVGAVATGDEISVEINQIGILKNKAAKRI